MATSKYKGVSYRLHNTTRSKDANRNPWKVRLYLGGGDSVSTSAPTERDAAIAYDKLCIQYGFQPVNILKPVNVLKPK